MLCLLLTILMCVSFYMLISVSVAGIGLSQKILLIFLFVSAQVIATELLLGLTGSLYQSILTAVNLSLSVAAFWYCHKKSNILIEIIQRDIVTIKDVFSNYLDCHNILLLLIIVPTYAWILMASYFLPLRGVDDLVYHLPPVFHYIQTHSISLLPVEIRHHFAFPQNAELLYLWPTIFFHNTRMLNSYNILFVLISVLLIREFLRFTPLSEKDALFASMLYALCPVVLMQAGSNYIDIIVALFYLLSLYYTLKYLEEQESIDALAAGVAAGIVCGMKYTMLFLSLPLQLVLLWKIFASRKKQHALLYLLPLMSLSCWWYIRNTVVVGSPVYPMNLFASGMGFTAGGGSSALGTDVLNNISQWIQNFPLHDLGLGSYDGGFGLIFWGLGFPAWICLSAITLASLRFELRKTILLLQLPLGFALLLAIPEKELIYVGRMALFVVAIGLFSLGTIMSNLKSNLCNAVIKSACLLFSLLAVSLMSTSTMPLFRLERVFADKRAGLLPSKYKYVQDANSVYAVLRHIWEPLDYLTRDDDAGLDCYVAADLSLVVLAPLYGSRLQNRLINIGEVSSNEPNALIYLAYPDRYRQGKLVRKDIRYYGYEIKLEDALSRTEMVVITQTRYGCLLMSRSFLQKPAKLSLLKKYYRETWPDEAAAARTLKEELTNSAPLITSNQLAYGLRCTYDGDDIINKIILVPEGYESHVALKRRVNKCYTLESPLRGYVSFPVAELKFKGRQITLYFNHVKELADA